MAHSFAILRPDDLPLYAVFILIPLLGGTLSFAACESSSTSRAWRRSLRRSRLTPNALITGVIWFASYVCMGHASYVTYQLSQPRSVLSPCIIAYVTQCLLNHFFIIVLFGLQRIDLALFMIIPLWLATAVATLLFYDVSVHAGRFMAPVLAWVSHNIYLNLFLYMYNAVYTEIEMQTNFDQAPKQLGVKIKQI